MGLPLVGVAVAEGRLVVPQVDPQQAVQVVVVVHQAAPAELG